MRQERQMNAGNTNKHKNIILQIRVKFKHTQKKSICIVEYGQHVWKCEYKTQESLDLTSLYLSAMIHFINTVQELLYTELQEDFTNVHLTIQIDNPYIVRLFNGQSLPKQLHLQLYKRICDVLSNVMGYNIEYKMEVLNAYNNTTVCDISDISDISVSL